MLWWTLRQLKSPKSKDRLQAVNKLAGVQDPRVMESLTKLLIHDPDAKVRQQTCVVVSELKDSDTVLPLIEALKDKNDGVKTAAAKCLARTNDERAIPALAEAMSQSDSKTQEKIAKELLGFGKEALPEFMKLLAGNAQEQRIAVKAIGEL